MIGYSDGTQYDSEFEAMLGPITSDPSTSSRRGLGATEKSAGEFKVDRGYNVPLIAAKTPEGIAIDHRVSTDMDFEGKKHDITPFLIAHENAEIIPMESAIKSGMEPKKAYELAHDKVANPAEAAVRNAYAIHNGLDVDKFNEAYWQHIEQQKKIAAEPSDRERHPDAHTTKYGLDPNTKVAMDMEDTPGYLLRHGGQNDIGGMGSSARQGPMIQPKPANENKDLEIRTQERENFDAKLEQLRDRLLGPKIRGTIPKEVMTSLKGLGHLGFDRPSDALNAIRDDIKRGADPKKNWDIRPEDDLMWKRVMDYIKANP